VVVDELVLKLVQPEFAISPVREMPSSPVRKDLEMIRRRLDTLSPKSADHRCATPVEIGAVRMKVGSGKAPSNGTMRIRERRTLSRSIQQISPPPRAPPWRPKRPARVSSGQRLVWVKKDLVQSRAFSQEDCFSVGRKRLPIPTEISFSRDLWSEKTGRASFVDIMKMAGGGRGGGRGGVGRGARKAISTQG
jgi:hypothetical protein